MKIEITFLLLSLRPPMSTSFSWEYSHIHDAQKKSAFIGGDVMIGALFPIHEAPSLSNQKNQLTCGAIREQYGIQRVEAALHTVDLINSSPHILPNITLGIEIRDTCWSPLMALYQSLQFVQKLFVTEGWYSCREKSPEKICRNQTPPILGVIGPASSEEAIQVQNLLQLFHIPQVGYSTTSPILSDRKKFQYFVRVVPSDNYQALVMVEILKKYNWSYVFAVQSEGEYGRRGMDKFKSAAEKNKICIASEHVIFSHTKPDKLDEIIRKFAQNGNAKIVVCFCEGIDVRRLLEATKRVKKEHSFVFIGSDGWAGRDDVVKDIEDLAQGNLMIRIHSADVADFKKYYSEASQRNDSRNPWLDEFRNHRFNCSMEKAPNMARCTGKESIAKDYMQDPKLSFIIKSIYALAHALHRYRNDICGKNMPVCDHLYPINGTLFQEYLQNVSFNYDKERIEFDNNGEVTARYDILNYQRINNDYKYVNVGNWTENKLKIDTDAIQLPGKMKTINSVCSEPCPFGYKKITPENGELNKTCCWSCQTCETNEISNGEICQACGKGFKPNNEKNKCIAMDHEYIHYSDLSGIVCTVFSTTGICLTLFTMLMFYKFADTPVVKSSTKELCYVMFAGMILAHSCTFILVGKPTTMTCVLARIIPGVSISVMYSALLVKTNRISRMLSMSKKRFPTLKPRFMSTISQLYICGFLISFEFLICVISIYLHPAQVEVNILQIPPMNHKAILECYSSNTCQELIFQFIFNVILLSLCTLYAFKTRKLPDNFNEAKCIGFACYATLITWLAFVSIYLGSHLQILSECISLSISAMINLIFLFFPKLYIMLCKPEKNTRPFFTTTKNLRCHIGSTYLIQNYEELMSKMLKNGFISNDAKFTYMNEFNEKAQEHHSNQMNSKLLTRDSTCQTSLERLDIKISDPPSNNDNEDISATSDEQELS